MPRLPTIKIVSDAKPRGFRIINATDFDAKTMTKFEATPTTNPSKMKVVDLKVELDLRGVVYSDEDKAPALKAMLQDALDSE